MISSILIVVSDLKHRRISNTMVAISAIACISLALTNESLGFHSLQSLFVLFIGLFLFKLGVIAAGDTKLLSVYALIIDPIYFPASLVLIGITGGVVTFPILLRKLISKKSNEHDRGIPYGIPIVISGMFGIYLSKLS
ncbi:A24 family peptidase [Enterovibrio norvegicus]|uniref:A24 family peptidase n=1 Tax=Enterovibrio norvegicus TaxID=188144 RepID=UPI001F53A09D|nr:prepilin peptidase [Enterovibrio norvegicus]